MIVLRPKGPFKVPVEAEILSPEHLCGKSAGEIGRMEVLYGRRRKRVEELFSVEERGEGEVLRLEGDFGRVKHVGAGMTRGRIEVKGKVGMHLGREMKGGEIFVEGEVGDWMGAEMSGGRIEVRGKAGNLVGAAYRGSKVGMKGGTIIVRGEAGREVGEKMRRGIIVVEGRMGDFAGALMTGGTIVCFGEMGEGAGGGMERGTILAFKRPPLLPTFQYSCLYLPSFLPLLLRYLQREGLPVREEHLKGKYERYDGDLACSGKGEILVWREGTC
ncbi:MAG: formylmethanofuran dehydrogenase subunit C [Candidatus Hadarchaeales archaeon]